MDAQTIDRVARALGRIPSGCAILTAKSGRRRMGMLASWIQQASFDPPAVSVAIKKDRPIQPLIDESGAFVLNLIGEDTQAMFRHFGKGFSPEDDAFEGLKTREVTGGVVVEGLLGWMSAKVRSRADAGDHWLYIGEIVEADANSDAAPHVHVRRNGLNY